MDDDAVLVKHNTIVGRVNSHGQVTINNDFYRYIQDDEYPRSAKILQKETKIATDVEHLEDKDLDAFLHNAASSLVIGDIDLEMILRESVEIEDSSLEDILRDN